jgi:hypothetical protein
VVINIACAEDIVSKINGYGKFQILTAASMKMAVFWNVAPCSLVEIDRRSTASYSVIMGRFIGLRGTTSPKDSYFYKRRTIDCKEECKQNRAEANMRDAYLCMQVIYYHEEELCDLYSSRIIRRMKSN